MDFKKIMIISAGVFIVVAAIFFVFLKPGGDEVGPITKEAQELVANNEVEKAFNLLLENESELDDQGKTLLEEIKVQLYPIYLEDAEKAFEEEAYVLALENYKKVLTVVPQGTDPKPIQKNIKELEELAEKILKLQKDYDQYMETFQFLIKNSNNLLSDFRGMLDQLEVSSITTDNFVSYFKSEVDTSNTILNKLDSGLTVSNEELLNIHKNVVNMANTQHDLILTSLTLTDANKAELIGQFKSQYLSLKQEQINLIQELNNFANKNHLEKVTIEQSGERDALPNFENEEATSEKTIEQKTDAASEDKTDTKTENPDETVSSEAEQATEDKVDEKTEESSNQSKKQE